MAVKRRHILLSTPLNLLLGVLLLPLLMATAMAQEDLGDRLQKEIDDGALKGLHSVVRGLIGIRVNFYHKDLKSPPDGLL